MKPIEIDGKRYWLVPVDAVDRATVDDLPNVAIPEVMTAKAFAELLRDGTNAATVRRRCKEGKLPAKHLGREWYVRAREVFGLRDLEVAHESK